MIVDSGQVHDYVGVSGPFNWARPGFGRYEPVMDRALDWCLDQFGIDSRDNWFYSFEKHAFYFRNQDHWLLFLLRWS